MGRFRNWNPQNTERDGIQLPHSFNGDALKNAALHDGEKGEEEVIAGWLEMRSLFPIDTWVTGEAGAYSPMNAFPKKCSRTANRITRECKLSSLFVLVLDVLDS